ncbi:DNA invertase Pin-like site-specific DNA recombinase [Paenibacillus sp. DS2015]|uniref:recombinase family protein n=1 Tax=Paenibacillus sp. DS2015 TaxID=3373917 RepID=UPI003D24E09C
MKIAIYARSLNTETHIEKQIELCQRYISFKKAELYGVYSDEGKSGHDSNREGLQLLIEDAENKEFDVIVTCGHYRLFREIKEINAFLKRMKKLNISHSVVHEE